MCSVNAANFIVHTPRMPRGETRGKRRIRNGVLKKKKKIERRVL